MTRSRWIIFILICLAILGLIIFTNKKDSSSNYAGDASKIITEGPIADHVFGSNKQKVILIEYGDYQCPGCESVYPLLKQITEQYKDNLTFVFRNFPLTNAHPNALAAATAAEAAGMQGKYYEYHDMLYEKQEDWKGATGSDRGTFFESYAKQLGLDVNKFKNDLSSSDISAKISRDRSTGTKSFSVDSTPTIVLNGEKLAQDVTFDKTKLSQAIEDEIRKAGL
jgi:protein-disulfide isomerase